MVFYCNSMTLTIRTQQLDVLNRVTQEQFKKRLYAWVKTHWSEVCLSLPSEELRGVLSDGVERALKYRITSERDLTRFVNVMFALGFQFDTDKRYPWAREVLSMPGVPMATRMDQLVDLASKALP